MTKDRVCATAEGLPIDMAELHTKAAYVADLLCAITALYECQSHRFAFPVVEHAKDLAKSLAVDLEEAL